MSQRRKIAREVSLGRLPEEALTQPDNLTLGQVRELYPEVNAELPGQLAPPLDAPVEAQVIDPPLEPA